MGLPFMILSGPYPGLLFLGFSPKGSQKRVKVNSFSNRLGLYGPPEPRRPSTHSQIVLPAFPLKGPSF